ncbi:hypothetical protein H5410_041380 [Solanum commersonii]|uniref:Uncharacterized protein n=1 Tax=Solanum commersonii TaxID=4109 RepID=A0A9J5XSW6_SOLCO|nr:hypothetical protein H5410_041380 [Solanum commersonii]
MQRVLIKEMEFLGCERNTAKSAESTRPKFKFLDLKPFESSNSSKPSPNFELKILSDHSASLVKNADQLDDPPFGRFHHRVALSFNIIVFWIIGRHRLSTLEQKARIRHFGDSPNELGDHHAVFSSFFQQLYYFLLDSVHAYVSKFQYLKFKHLHHGFLASLVEITINSMIHPLVGFIVVLLYHSTSSCFRSLDDIAIVMPHCVSSFNHFVPFCSIASMLLSLSLNT